MYNSSYLDWLKAQTFSKEQNERVQKAFNETVARIDALADECEIRRVLLDVFGHRSWMIDEPETLDAGRR